MKCSEYVEGLYDLFDTDNDALLSDLRQHAAECPNCFSHYQAFEEIVAILKPAIQLKAPATIKEGILRAIETPQATAGTARIIRTTSFWRKGAAIAAILIVLLAIPFLFRNGNGVARASALILTAIKAGEHIRNYVLFFSVRTDPNDDFEHIDPKESMVPHTLARSFDAPGAWSISKPGRKVVFDGKSQTLYIPAAKMVYKGDEQAGFVSWMRLLLDPSTILWKEEDIAESKNAKIEIFKRNGDTCLTVITKASGDLINDRLRNDNIGTADSKSEYVFDGKTHLLKGLKIYLLTSGKETLVFSMDKIVYDTVLAPGQLSFVVPPGLEVKTVRELQPRHAGDLSSANSKDAARMALEDMSKGDLESHKQMWVEYSQFSLALMKKGYKGTEVVHIGEPFESVSVSGEIVPYELRYPNGYIKRFRLVLDNKNAGKVWIVKGGL